MDQAIVNAPNDFVVIRRFSTVPEARVAQSVIDAAGIPSDLADDNIIAADWLYSNLVGGVKLLVPEDRIEEAAALLDTPAEALEDSAAVTQWSREAGDACATCGATSFEAITQGRRWTTLSWLVVGVPLVPVHHVRRCRRCGSVSRRDERGRV